MNGMKEKFVIVSGASEYGKPLDDATVDRMLREAREGQERQPVMSCRSHEEKW